MIRTMVENCPDCNGELYFYDTVQRKLLTKYRKSYFIRIRRMKCNGCGRIHRELPDIVVPYKLYESEIIFGVVDGLISADALEYENYPCSGTMAIWKGSQNLQII